MSVGFLETFLRRAAHEPDADAVVLYAPERSTTLTGAALKRGALRWTTAFRARGAQAGDVILLALPLSSDLIEAFLGALLAGCVPSLMPCPSAKQDPQLFWSSHNSLFARLGGGPIVTTAENAPQILRHVVDTVMVIVTPADAAAAAPCGEDAITPRMGQDIACLQHSSGTTGLKKGVALSFDMIEAQVGAYVRALDIRAADTIVSWLPLYHDMGFVACLLLPLSLGVMTVLLDPFAWLTDPLSVFEAIERHAGTFAWMPNFAFAHLTNAAGDSQDNERRFDITCLRALIDCSEACRPATLASFERRFTSWGLRQDCLRTCYAMAETVFAVTQSAGAPLTVALDRHALEEGRVARAAGGIAHVSSGTPLMGVELEILNDGLEPVASDGIGQIAVKAPFLFSGYHLEPQRAAKAFHGSFYLTGDFGFMLEGELFVLGRRDDQIVLLGRNVFANEVEALLEGIAGLKAGRVLALGLHDEAIGSQHLVILAEPDAAAAVDRREIQVRVRERLESILAITPRRMVFVERGWLVKSTSGKFARGEIHRKFLDMERVEHKWSA